MIVYNSTKSIITLPIDHKGTAVARCTPGWSDQPDETWFERLVDALDESEAKGFGKVIKHGAEVHAKSRIDAGHLKVLGEVERKNDKGPRVGKTLQDVTPKEAVGIVKEVNNSATLTIWLAAEGRNEVRAAIQERFAELSGAKK